MLDDLLSWATAHGTLLSITAAVSVAMLVATPLLVPWWIASLREDYFVQSPGAGRRSRSSRLRTALASALGLTLVLAGILMLFLPGQGVLSILVGLSLMRFPGKKRLQARLLAKPRVAAALQWMRRRAGRPPLQLPH